MPDTEHLLHKTKHLYNSNVSRENPYPRHQDFTRTVGENRSLPRKRSLPMSAGSNHNYGWGLGVHDSGNNNQETHEFINIDYRSNPQNPNQNKYTNQETGDPDAYQ